MKKKNGFTLIELLAVIIILGILMIIAIPSVTKYISDSRKNSYVDSAKEIIGSARNLVNSGELEMYDTDATYYIDVNCIKTENAMKSPYGDFTNAYVVVTYDGKGYDYFWTSVDDAGQGVKNIVKYDKLDIDDISSDLTIDDISTLRTLDGRGKVILITERNSCKKEGAITENLIPVNSETGEEGGSSGGNGGSGTSGAASTILAAAQTAGQLNQIEGTNIYIFKGGTTNAPANYVKFNNETWRIIGIYNGQMKIIRVNSNGVPTAPAGFTSVQFNTSTPNPGYGASTLKTSLNTTYYDTLTTAAKNMIDESAEWNVGPVTYNATASQAYTSATTSGTVSSTTPLVLNGENEHGIGLLASYEFLYATGGGDSCLTTAGNSYSSSCGTATNDWLKPGASLWTLSPRSDIASDSLRVYLRGYVDSFYVTGDYAAVPAVFLKSSVTIASGDGTNPEHAYVLKLE